MDPSHHTVSVESAQTTPNSDPDRRGARVKGFHHGVKWNTLVVKGLKRP